MDSAILSTEKTVLEVDVVEYTRGAVNMQENIGLPGLKMYEDQNRWCPSIACMKGYEVTVVTY